MMDKIYERFVEVMTEKKITQAELAHAIGKSQQSVNMTLARPFTKITYFIGLSELTDCSLLWLLTGEGLKYVNYPDMMEVLQNEILKLTNIIDDLMDQLSTQKELVVLLKKSVD